MKAARTTFIVVVLLTTLLPSCGQPWQPITKCPDPHDVATAIGNPHLVLQGTSSTGDRVNPDAIICNYGDPSAADAEDDVVPTVGIFQFRGEFLKKAEKFDNRATRPERRTIDSPVARSQAYASALSALLTYAFSDGRLDLQYVQPVNALPLSDQDARSRLSQLATLVGLQAE